MPKGFISPEADTIAALMTAAPIDRNILSVLRSRFGLQESPRPLFSSSGYLNACSMTNTDKTGTVTTQTAINNYI